MRILRFVEHGQARWGACEEGATMIRTLAADPMVSGIMYLSEEEVPLTGVKLCAPVEPRTVIGIGRNYAEHAREMGGDVPDEPVVFLVPPGAIIGPEEAIVLPQWSQEVHYEAELAVVIGKTVSRVSVEDAHEVIFGYTCVNDVSARDAQRSDHQWARAKGFDTSTPIGPWIVTADSVDPTNLRIQAYVNGECRQDGRTSDMLRSVDELVSYLSHGFTLHPGDVIMTGTPAGVGKLVDGDQVEVRLEGIGTLSNPVQCEII